MFEKEAEEYADEKCGTIETEEKKFCRIDWQKGAEFGYQKGLEFGVKSNEKVNKIVANEWHREVICKGCLKYIANHICSDYDQDCIRCPKAKYPEEE